MKFLNWLALIIAAVGAINWGILAILEKDLIAGFLSLGWEISRIVYIVVGVAGVWSLLFVRPGKV